MRKLCLAIIMFLILCPGVTQAQDRKLNLSLNFGLQTDLWRETAFDYLLGTVDVRVGFRLGRSFRIGPELMYVTGHKFNLSYGFFYPAIMLNFTSGNIFIGAGATMPVFFDKYETATGNPAPKLNIGFMKGNLVFTAYIIMWAEDHPSLDFPNVNFIGATAGYRF